MAPLERFVGWALWHLFRRKPLGLWLTRTVANFCGLWVWNAVQLHGQKSILKRLANMPMPVAQTQAKTFVEFAIRTAGEKPRAEA